MFRWTAIIALPIVIVLLFVNIANGVIAKSAPQLNLFSFGFPMMMIGSFIILLYSVDAIAFVFKDLIQVMIDLIMSIIVDQTDG